MAWYIAKLIFHVCLPDTNCVGQFEEKLRLIHASGQQTALHKASVAGEEEETAFSNASGEKVKWEFIAVSELRILPEITDGMELASHLEEVPAEEEYIALQREKHRKLFLQTE